MKQKFTLSLVYGVFLWGIVLVLFIGIASAGGPPDQVGGLKIVTATPTPTPMLLSCPPMFECLLTMEAQQKWPGGFMQYGSIPCGQTSNPVQKTQQVQLNKYCYKPIESNSPAVVPVQVQPPQQVIPAKQVIPAQPVAPEAVPVQKNVQEKQVVPANPQVNQPPGLPDHDQVSGSGISGSATSTQTGVWESFINFFSFFSGNGDKTPREFCPKESPQSCEDGCKNTMTDNSNCGACGNVCPENQGCQVGRCITCPEGQMPCMMSPGAGHLCTDVSLDNGNCGACGVTCGQGTGCLKGVCTWTQSDTITGSVSPSTINCKNTDTALKFTGTANVPVGTPVYLKIFNAPSSSLNVLPWDGVLIGSANIRTDTSYEYIWNGVIPGYILNDGQDYLVETMLSDSMYVQQIIHYTCAGCGVSCAPTETCSDGKCVSLCNVKLSTLTSFSWADWQGTNWLTSVKNQGSCGSCWAEAPTGTTEAVYNLETGYQNNVDISEQAIVSGCYGDMGSCMGGWNDLALSSLQSIGIPEESAMPYSSASCGLHFDPPGSRNAVCNADCNQNNPSFHCSIPNTCNLGVLAPDTKIWKIQSYHKENSDSGDKKEDIDKEFNSVKHALLCNGPLSVCSGHWWHCVTLVGWRGDIRDPDGGWVIKNSWGDTWNGNGYGLIPYGDPWSKKENDHNDILLDAWSVKGVYHVP